MAGHMGARTTSVLNLLVVMSDPTRNLLFVEGSVPGSRGGIVIVEPGRRKPLAAFLAPTLPAGAVAIEAGDDAAAEPVGVAEGGADEQNSEAAE
jgi:large subunit ribosomal protein L3